MNKPIGYWLKHLDNLFESAMDDALAEQGVTRRQWQILNALAHNAEDPRDALRPFSGVTGALDELTARGWIADDRLTDAGRDAHAVIAQHVGRFRQRAVDGVSTQEYQATVDVLSRMCANLEPAHS
ncbi:MarR family transcriptional regulator [Nonomuraea sp. NPDC000554]|uniref:MarR family winged helix-turn-helix transcriptional regulator n=1 Tax=Nonomuraea sp. NPDC000554 TaxID=3154259 RepID=UPI00333177AB